MGKKNYARSEKLNAEGEKREAEGVWLQLYSNSRSNAPLLDHYWLALWPKTEI